MTKKYPLGMSLSDIIKDQNISLNHPIIGARVNNEIEELSYEIFKPKIIEFIDISDGDGMRIYIRSLTYVLIKAVYDLFPKASISVDHAVSKGYYCELEGIKLSRQIISDIEHRMRELVDKDIPFVRKEIEVKEAIKLFRKWNYTEKIKLFQFCPEFFTSIYYLDNMINYFFGYLAPSTGYLKVFDLVEYYDGILLRIPKRDDPGRMEDIIKQDKLFDIFTEYKNWVEILGVKSVGSVNEAVVNERSGEFIKIGEALHEKKVAMIADEINSQKHQIKIILISGPSSSGKTTFSKRLAIQLKVLGLKPIQLSLDNYFVNREETPRDKDGHYNFEALEAIDIELFTNNYRDLTAGKEVSIPKFSFENGKRYFPGHKIQLSEDNILLIEGIHALNPALTKPIPEKEKFKVYVSALTQIGIDDHNRIPTTDNRLIRRIVRDYKYRGYSALETLRRWPSVRKGEEKNIFPYQEEADVMFNSALIFELGVLKTYAEPLLREIVQVDPEYSESQRLLKFLSYFKPIKPDEIPPTSILREFLYGSTFKYD